MPLTKFEVDQMNMDFVKKSLYQISPKNAQAVILLAVSEAGELLITNSSRITPKEAYNLLMEAARALENKKDSGLIVLP